MNLSYTIFVDRQMTEVRDVANLEGMAADKAMECIRHALGGRDPQEGEYVADLGIRVDRIEKPIDPQDVRAARRSQIYRSTADKRVFRYRLYDRRYGGEVGTLGGESMVASCKTEVRAILAKAWKRDTPRDARNCGFCPWSDVRIVWEA